MGTAAGHMPLYLQVIFLYNNHGNSYSNTGFPNPDSPLELSDRDLLLVKIEMLLD
jgi:hypothetical protein